MKEKTLRDEFAMAAIRERIASDAWDLLESDCSRCVKCTWPSIERICLWCIAAQKELAKRRVIKMLAERMK